MPSSYGRRELIKNRPVARTGTTFPANGVRVFTAPEERAEETDLLVRCHFKGIVEAGDLFLVSVSNGQRDGPFQGRRAYLRESSKMPKEIFPASFVSPKVPYTSLQGQYLAFIHYFNLVNGQPPAHSDFQRYFRTPPPAVNQMLKTLEKKGLISKVPGKPRAISLVLSREELPDLEPVSA